MSVLRRAESLIRPSTDSEIASLREKVLGLAIKPKPVDPQPTAPENPIIHSAAGSMTLILNEVVLDHMKNLRLAYGDHGVIFHLIRPCNTERYSARMAVLRQDIPGVWMADVSTASENGRGDWDFEHATFEHATEKEIIKVSIPLAEKAYARIRNGLDLGRDPQAQTQAENAYARRGRVLGNLVRIRGSVPTELLHQPSR
jgi:hypothetical protein